MDSITNSVNDPLNLVEKIVFEVKSQGLFDRFRKECIADVDTKPAYQNLRQRVESSVTNFLKDQKWSAELNKNHLRDKLRKQVTESGFLETGVERIVDQVVNPKITTTFLPQVEDIVCKYLGLEKLPYKVAPTFKFSPSVELKIETDLLPTDLEAVSPDSEKSESNYDTKHSPCLNVDHNETGHDKIEEFESPPFEPLCSNDKILKEESNDSNMSVISGLTSQDSVTSEKEIMEIQQSNFENVEEKPTNMLIEAQDNMQLLTRASPDSQLSQVSSDSRLSILTHSNSSKSGIVESEPQENTSSVEPRSTSTIPESSQHTFIDIKNEFEKTIIKGGIVDKVEIDPICNDESITEEDHLELMVPTILKEKIEINKTGNNNEDFTSINEGPCYSKESSCSSQELTIVLSPNILEQNSTNSENLEEIKQPVTESKQQYAAEPEITSRSLTPPILELPTFASSEKPCDDIQNVNKDVISSKYSVEPNTQLHHEVLTDNKPDSMERLDNSNFTDAKTSRRDFRHKGCDDSRKFDSKSATSRYSKSYSDDRNRDNYRSRDRSRDKKYSLSKSSRERNDRDYKYDHSRSRTSTPDKPRGATSSSSRSSKKYSSSDKLYDKKKYKNDDHSSSRLKNQDKRRSTDHDSNDGSNDGYTNSRSNSSSNQNYVSSQSNSGSNSTSYTNNSVSTTNAASDHKPSDRDYKKDINSSNRSKYESSSKNYDSKYSSSSSSKRRFYETAHSSSSKSKKSRYSRDDDLLYFPDKNRLYRAKSDNFVQFASDLRKQCKYYNCSIFLSDTHRDFIKILQRKHGSIINFQNNSDLLILNKSEPINIRIENRTGHHLNKKLFRENNQINLNILQQNNMMKLDDIITNEKVLLQLNNDNAFESVNKRQNLNTGVSKNNIVANTVTAKSHQSFITPNEVTTPNLSNSTVKSLKTKINQKSSQTYSNEDLYKPRNVFGQRSRRRALNNDDIF